MVVHPFRGILPRAKSARRTDSARGIARGGHGCLRERPAIAGRPCCDPCTGRWGWHPWRTLNRNAWAEEFDSDLVQSIAGKGERVCNPCYVISLLTLVEL